MCVENPVPCTCSRCRRHEGRNPRHQTTRGALEIDCLHSSTCPGQWKRDRAQAFPPLGAVLLRTVACLESGTLRRKLSFLRPFVGWMGPRGPAPSHMQKLWGSVATRCSRKRDAFASTSTAYFVCRQLTLSFPYVPESRLQLLDARHPLATPKTRKAAPTRLPNPSTTETKATYRSERQVRHQHHKQQQLLRPEWCQNPQLQLLRLLRH